MVMAVLMPSLLSKEPAFTYQLAEHFYSLVNLRWLCPVSPFCGGSGSSSNGYQTVFKGSYIDKKAGQITNAYGCFLPLYSLAKLGDLEPTWNSSVMYLLSPEAATSTCWIVYVGGWFSSLHTSWGCYCCFTRKLFSFLRVLSKWEFQMSLILDLDPEPVVVSQFCHSQSFSLGCGVCWTPHKDGWMEIGR